MMRIVYAQGSRTTRPESPLGSEPGLPLAQPLDELRAVLAEDERADLQSELAVALPLRLVEELVGGAFLRERRALLLVLPDVERRAGDEPRLHHDQPARPAAFRIGDAVEQGALVLRGLVAAGEVRVPAEDAAQARMSVEVVHQPELRAVIDARKAEERREVFEAVLGVASIVARDDYAHVALGAQELVGGGVLEVSAVGEVEPRAVLAVEAPAHLVGEVGLGGQEHEQQPLEARAEVVRAD